MNSLSLIYWRLRNRACRHRWMTVSFVYGAWVECEKCGARR